MDWNFGTVNEDDPFVVIPGGVYLCRVAEVRTRASREGSEQWGLRLEGVGGEYAGRTLAWDNLTWSERGVVRIKRVLEALGFDVSGTLSLQPEDLQGLQTLVTLQLEEYEGAERTTKRMGVPYSGYAPAGEAPTFEAPEPNGAAMPF